MDDGAAPDTNVSDDLSEVLRLTTALADRVLAELVAGRIIAKDQADALATAVNGLRKQGVILPPTLEQALQAISKRAAQVIKQTHGPVGATVSWSFGKLRGARRTINWQ